MMNYCIFYFSLFNLLNYLYFNQKLILNIKVLCDFLIYFWQYLYFFK